MACPKGKGGPKRKPTAAKKLAGTYREDRHGTEVTAKPGEPSKPTWLSKGAEPYWREIVEYANEVPGLLATLDGNSVAAFAESIHDYVTARDIVEAEGTIAVSEKGTPFQHPAVGQKNKAAERMRHWIARFGMSPVDRTSLRIPQKQDDKKDPFAAFLERANGKN